MGIVLTVWGHRELKGAFFNVHGPADTMSWFSDHGVELKTENDGRVFPVSNSSSSVIDCLISELEQSGVRMSASETLWALDDAGVWRPPSPNISGGSVAQSILPRFSGCFLIFFPPTTLFFLLLFKGCYFLVSMQTGKIVTKVSSRESGKFLLKVEKRSLDFVESIETDYILIASGSSRQGYTLAAQLGHTIVDPVPSLFTFKVRDSRLVELSGVTFNKVKAKLKLEHVQRNISQLTQVGPMLITHWGLSGPVILRLSAWGARVLFTSSYNGELLVDFTPDLHVEDIKSILNQHKRRFAKQKMLNSCPSEFGIMKRFWKYLLEREGLDGNTLWASCSNNSLNSVASLLKQCEFSVSGKGQFKDEFVTAGGVPLSEIALNTMESRKHPHLFFAGEVLNVDGVTGGFNFQNAWSGGYIAGTSIGELALSFNLKEQDHW